MKKTFIWFCALNFTFVFNLKAQKDYNPDHIEEFGKIEHEEIRYLIQEAGKYYFFNPDTTIFLARQAIELSRKKEYVLGEIIGLNLTGSLEPKRVGPSRTGRRCPFCETGFAVKCLDLVCLRDEWSSSS